MQLMKLAYFCLICIYLKLECADVFPRMVYPDRMSPVVMRFEARRKQYAQFELLENMLNVASSISPDEVQKIFNFVIQLFKKQIESAKVSPESQPDYWLLRQG